MNILYNVRLVNASDECLDFREYAGMNYVIINYADQAPACLFVEKFGSSPRSYLLLTNRWSIRSSVSDKSLVWSNIRCAYSILVNKVENIRRGSIRSSWELVRNVRNAEQARLEKECNSLRYNRVLEHATYLMTLILAMPNLCLVTTRIVVIRYLFSGIVLQL